MNYRTRDAASALCDTLGMIEITNRGFKALVRGFIATRMNAGKSGGKAIEELLKLCGGNDASKQEACGIATDVLHELEAVRTRRKATKS